MFKKYQRKTAYVEAAQFTDETKDRVYNSLTGNVAADWENGKPILKVKTIHGDIAIVRLGDWIIKEPRAGCYYPCKADIFEKTYKLAD